MALQETVIPVDFGQGVDTKTDSKSVVPGKFIRLENGVFTNPKRIAKRNGYTATGTTIASVGTLTSPKMVHDYGNELIAADQNLLLSYSSNQDAWVSKGAYTSVGLERDLVSTDTTANGVGDTAILGNYVLNAWDTGANIYASITDISTNTVLIKSVIASGLVGNRHPIKCACLAGTTLAVVYYNDSNQIRAHTVTFSGSGVVSFSAATTIASNATGEYDLVATATGGAFVYKQTTTPGITVATLSVALAVATATLAVTTGLSTVVAVSTTSNGNIWAYWTEATDDGVGNLTALSIYYAVYSSALAVVLARTAVVVVGTPFYVSTMTAKSDSATQQTLYYGVFTTNNNGATRMLEYSRYITATSAGVVGASTLFANGVIPFSHPFTVGTRIYAVFLYRMSEIVVTIGATLSTPTQSTFFIVELTNLRSPPLVVARFASGTANSVSGFYMLPMSMGNVAAFSSDKFYFSCGITIQIGSGYTPSFVNGVVAMFLYAFDFNSNDAYIARNTGKVAALNGAVMQMYDGEICSELNFHLHPEITDLTQGAGGSIADGVYSYQAIFNWVDSKGCLHQSTPSPASIITVAVGGGTASVTATIITNFLSQKPNSSIDLYRTTGAGGTTGSIYYLASFISPAISATATTNAIITYVDTFADATIDDRPQAYTYPASDILENTTPPPSTVMTTHNNRLFFVDAENPETDIWYTKSSQPLVGISPSGLMTQVVDAKFGKIIALAEMDEKLVTIKEKGIIAQSGDGVTDAGNGSTFSFPQFIPSDVGCSSQKSVVLTPEGLLFKSPNGIYMLNRSLNVGYVGSEVESYNSQTITGATLVPGKSQIRFLTSSGSTLVYDYIFKQWSTFTNHTGYSSTAWNGLYVYATTGGKVLKESSTSYLDDATAYKLLAQTSWLSLASIQGFQRVRRLAMLGDFVNGTSAAHALSIQAAYDFSTTFQTAVSYSFGAISTSGVFQYRERLPQQKCDSISLLIEETTTGSSLEYIDLTNISFEVAVKRGLNKLRGQQSVG